MKPIFYLIYISTFLCSTALLAAPTVIKVDVRDDYGMTDCQYSGDRSLRCAIIEANNAPQNAPYLIELSLKGGYGLTRANSSIDSPDWGDLDSMVDITIKNTSGDDVIIFADDLLGDRVLEVHSGTLVFDKVKVAKGKNVDDGGCVFVRSNASLKLVDTLMYECQADKFGGAIAAESSSIIYLYGSSQVTYNTAYRGGGIATNGSLQMGNSSSVDHNAAGADGGGIWSSSTVGVYENAKIKDNTADRDGGGIYADLIQLYDDVEIKNNDARIGGGLYGDVYLKDHPVISGNHADVKGGGIYSTNMTTSGSATVSQNDSVSGGGIFIAGTSDIGGSIEISSNTASKGGGLYVEGASVTIEGALFEDNVVGNTSFPASQSRGGGIFFKGKNGKQLTIEDSQFISNKSLTSGGAYSYGIGGAIYLEGYGSYPAGSTIVVDRSHFYGNFASYGGAAFYGTNSCNYSFENSSFISNDKVTAYGGNGYGAVLSGATSCQAKKMQNLTFEGNGGGPLLKMAPSFGTNEPMVHITFNQPGQSLFTSDSNHLEIMASVIDGTCLATVNLVSLNYNVQSSGASSCISVAQPLDFLNTIPYLSPAQDNGGGTFTCALNPASKQNLAISGVSFDQRGEPRNPNSADPGAYEAP